MRIAVLGASGNTGSVVAEAALENGHDLRAVARNPDSLTQLRDRGAEIVTADLDDSDEISSAISGVDAVYYCSPLAVGFDKPFAIERTRGRGVINAARSSGIEHFVLLSAMGPETAPEVALIESKRAVEGDLVASGLAYTILRPSMFMDNVAMAGPEALLGFGLTWPFSENALIQPIAAADIANIAFQSMTSGPRNRSFDLVGPQALTFPQIASELGRAMGAELRFTAIPDEVFIEHVGAAIGSTEVAAAIAGAYRLWERDGSGTGDAAVLEREFDISLTSFQDYAASLAATWSEKV
ncbi:MAG: NAD(P)H-binding protein [Woeseiaceae bacterium]|nr:NAD(P)H-binding protein [Woeseiaceae bacterium]